MFLLILAMFIFMIIFIMSLCKLLPFLINQEYYEDQAQKL